MSDQTLRMCHFNFRDRHVRHGQIILFFAKSSLPTVGPTKLYTEWLLLGPSPQMKIPGVKLIHHREYVCTSDQ
jgi:hypothetical protein